MATNGDNTLEWRTLLLLLVLAPLPSGSVSPLAESLLKLGIFAVLAMSIVRTHLPLLVTPEGYQWRIRVIWLCWGLAVAFAFFQVLPLRPGIIASLSPSLFDLYGWSLPEPWEDGVWRSLSTTPGATIETALMIAACGATFFLVTHLCRTRKRAVVLALTIVLLGAAQALYGLAQVGGSLALARPASGTFVDRNHFAAFLGMALCLSVGLLLYRWQEAQHRQATQARFSAPQIGARVDRWARTSPQVLLCLTILAGMIFSFSRTGLAAPIVTLVLFGALWLLGPVSRRIRLVGSGIGAAALLLLGGAWPALNLLTNRFRDLEESYRMAAWKGTYTLFQSSPVVGVGLGGLSDNLPRFLPVPIGGIFQHSHNEPLELLAEGGVVYASFFVIGLGVYFGTLIPAWLARRDPLARGLGLGCLAGSTAILIQSLVEFPLRIPANAVYLSVILGLGWVVIHRWTTTDAPSSRQVPASSSSLSAWTCTPVFLIAMSGLGICAVATIASFLDAVGDMSVRRAANMPGEAREMALERARKLHHQAAQIEPWQPVHIFKVGRVYEATAGTLPALSKEAMGPWDSAARSYEHAVRLHPANPRLQAALAWASLQGGYNTGGRRAAQAALRLAPDDAHVRVALSQWYLTQWETLNQEEQRVATSLVQRGALELPQRYLEALWRSVRDPNVIRQLLPQDLAVRRLLVKNLTRARLFRERWAEQAANPALQASLPESRVRLLSHGQLTGRQQPPQEAAAVGAWTGMVDGWLSEGLKARLNLDLPPGEVVLYIPILGEPAGGVWPELKVKLGGKRLRLPAITRPGWRTAYVLLSTRGGKYQLRAAVTNGAVILENGQFRERRAQLGPVRVLTPQRSTLF